MSVAQVYQKALLTEYVAAAPATPANRDPMHGFLRGVEDDALDVVGAGSSVNGCEAEFEQIDAESDACFARARVHIKRGEYALADAEIERGIFLDDQERRPVGKGFRAVRVMAESGRQIVAKIERLLSSRRKSRAAQRAGGQR